MNTHNATKYKTRVGTFQLKYSHGGNLGSYSCKLSEIKPKKVHVPKITANELIFMALRVNRVLIEQTIYTYCSLSYVATKKAKQALKGYLV
jgi:hypothetical protein